MAIMRRSAAILLFAGLVLPFGISSSLHAQTQGSKAPGVAVRQNDDYHGLRAISLRNGTAEAVIVPAAGRLMSFRLTGDGGTLGENPIWNNPKLGPDLKPDDEGWINYGGDKTWPAPQADWPKITGKGWPPPTGFDHMPFTASVKGSTVTLTSPVDPSYGIRVVREITLDPARPVLKVETRYEKQSGPDVRVAAWTIAQLNAPEKMFILLPQNEKIPGGFIKTPRNGPNDPYPPEKVSISGRLLSVGRDPKVKRKLGSDGDKLLWLGKSVSLLIEKTASKSSTNADFPHGGAHTEIYTNPDELPYVELELLGPLTVLKAGERVSLHAQYTLAPRSGKDATAEARRLFGTK